MKSKLNKLKENIKKYDRVMVAFSGGTDSTFLLAVCAETIGKENTVAVTAASGTYTESELASATEISAKFGVTHEIIKTDELNDPLFLSNPADRCYHCKKNFYSKVLALSEKMGIKTVFDGSNADDVTDYRPGRKATLESGIKSPLLEEGFSKNDIRAFSRKMDLPTWNKPANPCLASRIPYGNIITKKKLETIATAEAFIHNEGFETVRVRHHDSMARIEIPVSDFPRFIRDDIRTRVNQYLKSLGFIWITIDIEGYKMGSLNKAIK